MSAQCGNCVQFDARVQRLEAALPGLTALGSAHASVRAGDGLCDRHDRYVAATSGCAHHVPRRTGAAVTGRPD